MILLDWTKNDRAIQETHYNMLQSISLRMHVRIFTKQILNIEIQSALMNLSVNKWFLYLYDEIIAVDSHTGFYWSTLVPWMIVVKAVIWFV